MKIREWWLQVDMNKVMDINSESIWVGWTTGPKDPNNIHVIDASGMPSKEEIRKALEMINDTKGLNCPAPQLEKVIAWLEKLAAE